MSMNFGNPALQNMGIVAWDGTTSAAIDIRKHINFGFTFEVFTGDLALDTTFAVQAAPASDADVCVPGVWHDVEEVLICESWFGGAPQPTTEIVLPAGTPKGAKCTAGLPCKPDAFITLVPLGGNAANVRAVVTLSRPR